MTVRKKLILAYIVAGIFLILAMKALAAVGASGLSYFFAAIVAATGLVAFAIVIKCPNCRGRPFALRWLPLFYVPNTCATCDREFFD